MAFDITQFRANLIGGGARNNLFQVVLPTPTGAAASLNTEKLSFMCKSASLPGSMISPIELPYFGRTIKVAGDRVFEDWQIIVINDESFDIRNAFERWHSAMAAYSTVQAAKHTNGATSDPSSYSVTGEVWQYGKEGDIIKKIQIFNMFPTSIGPIQLSWDANSQVEEFDVTFSYDYFTAMDGSAA